MNTVIVSKAIYPLLVALVLMSAPTARSEPEPVQLAAAPNRCSAPRDAGEATRCADWARQIMDATVFLRFALRHSWEDDHREVELITSHGTILNSTTLLTHDHYDSLFDPDCTVASLEVIGVRSSLNLVAEDADDAEMLDYLVGQLRPDPAGSRYQTRLLRFAMPLFEKPTGLSFGSFTSAPSYRTLSGWGELAEVNWTKSQGNARVQWVRPLYSGIQGTTLALVAGKAVAYGASGGGVFRVTPSGIEHLGNVWGTWEDNDTSIIALNQAAVFW
jgi:hypothetical protein